MPAPNRQFGASGGVISWDTSQDFGSSPPVQALPIPPPAAKLLKRCAQVAACYLESRKELTIRGMLTTFGGLESFTVQEIFSGNRQVDSIIDKAYNKARLLKPLE